MSFEYSCFISYRHGQREIMERFVKDLHEALSNEIALRTEKEIFVDWKRLEGGSFFNQKIARALCESVCMIVVFTPTYFSDTDTYCAREYKAMEKLEKERLRFLESSVQSENGLIIPIVLRGEGSLPPEIKERRQYHDFGKFKLRDVPLKEHPDFDSIVEEIAEYIYQRYQILDALPEDVCSNCTDFTFPAEAEIQAWLQEVVIPKSPFPGR